jgi:hypothetical protein
MQNSIFLKKPRNLGRARVFETWEIPGPGEFLGPRSWARPGIYFDPRPRPGSQVAQFADL